MKTERATPQRPRIRINNISIFYFLIVAQSPPSHKVRREIKVGEKKVVVLICNQVCDFHYFNNVDATNKPSPTPATSASLLPDDVPDSLFPFLDPEGRPLALKTARSPAGTSGERNKTYRSDSPQIHTRQTHLPKQTNIPLNGRASNTIPPSSPPAKTITLFPSSIVT